MQYPGPGESMLETNVSIAMLYIPLTITTNVLHTLGSLKYKVLVMVTQYVAGAWDQPNHHHHH